MLFIKHPDGIVKYDGAENILQAFSANQELCDQAKNLVSSTLGPLALIVVLSYPLLPCSTQLRISEVCCRQLSQMLVLQMKAWQIVCAMLRASNLGPATHIEAKDMEPHS